MVVTSAVISGLAAPVRRPQRQRFLAPLPGEARAAGRLWIAIGGTALGAVGFAGTAALLRALGG